MIRYLSDEWFLAVGRMLPGRAAGIDFTVTTQTGAAGTSPAHTQRFSGDDLVEWVPGADPAADLFVTRDVAIDEADLLARGDPQRTADATRLAVGPVGESTDVWGVAPCAPRRPPGVPDDLALEVTVASPDTPFGAVSGGLRVDAGGARPVPSRREPGVTVAAPYAEVIGWLHDPGHLLGHLIVRGHAIEGGLFELSAVEGIVSWPEPDAACGARRRSVLERYGQLRTSPGFAEVIDAVDAITA
jgi:hypothetical protein